MVEGRGPFFPMPLIRGTEPPLPLIRYYRPLNTMSLDRRAIRLRNQPHGSPHAAFASHVAEASLAYRSFCKTLSGFPGGKAIITDGRGHHNVLLALFGNPWLTLGGASRLTCAVTMKMHSLMSPLLSVDRQGR